MTTLPTEAGKVFFSASVEANNGHHTSVGTPGCETLAEALSLAFQDATYYILQCGYDAPTISVSAYCRKCGGTGHLRIDRPRSVKHRRCPDCKGRAVTEVIPPFVAKLHENCQVAR